MMQMLERGGKKCLVLKKFENLRIEISHVWPRQLCRYQEPCLLPLLLSIFSVCVLGLLSPSALWLLALFGNQGEGLFYNSLQLLQAVVCWQLVTSTLSTFGLVDLNQLCVVPTWRRSSQVGEDWLPCLWLSLLLVRWRPLWHAYCALCNRLSFQTWHGQHVLDLERRCKLYFFMLLSSQGHCCNF